MLTFQKGDMIKTYSIIKIFKLCRYKIKPNHFKNVLSFIIGIKIMKITLIAEIG